MHEINIDKAMHQSEIAVGHSVEKREYIVEVKVTGDAKRIKITYKNDRKRITPAQYLQNVLKKRQGQQLSFSLDLKGVCLSFIDDKP
jgi:hypothetical protein